MFIQLNPAYLIALMFFFAGCIYIIMTLISTLGNTGVRTRRIYNATSVLLVIYSVNYGLMTITAHDTLRQVFWAFGYSAGLLFFPVWIFFLLHMIPPKKDIIRYISACSIGVAVIIALLCIFLGETVFYSTDYGTRFLYHGNIYFIIGLGFTSFLTIPLVGLQFIWWSGAETLRFRKIAKAFIIIAPLTSAIGFITDLVLPIFTTTTVTPLGPVTILLAAMTTYFLMFSSKTRSITMHNVSGFTFSSIMMPILVLDRKDKVGLENKAAVNFFGKSLIDTIFYSYIMFDGKTARQSYFTESFTNAIITVDTPTGIKTCELMLTVERDKLGDVLFKVVVIRDRTESYYKDSLLEAVNQVSSILLEPDIGFFEINLYMAMGMLAKAVDVDRVYVWENHNNNGQIRCTQIYEWSEGAEPQQGTEHTIDVSYDDIYFGLEEDLSGGRCLNALVKIMDDDQYEYFSAQGIKSILVAPVFIQNAFWGFVGFDDCSKERVFAENEEKILRSASRLIVNAMIRNDMTQKLETALTDELTGARNRRYFTETAEAELLDCIDKHKNYSVIILDVDFFKKVNDTYGHPVGDDVLRILVSRISNTLKIDTLLARYGGEEFIVTLPDTGKDGVVKTAERIRESIENSAFKIGDLELKVTISLGAASLNDDVVTLSDVISNADKALYKAKQTGRNRVVYYEGE